MNAKKSLFEKLTELVEKWENAPYTGDLTKAVQSICAQELREVLGIEKPNSLRRGNTSNRSCVCNSEPGAMCVKHANEWLARQ